MALPVLVMGRSGTGKSRSLKFFTPEEVGVIKVIDKSLPFKSDLKTVVCSDYAKLFTILQNSKTKRIIIDDAGYLLTDEFMRRSDERGYDKFTELANNFYNLIKLITMLPSDKIVYVIMHENENDVTGEIKPKTIGKLLDEKVCVEGLFTIVLRCVIENGKHCFKTNNSGCAKSPEDMFEETIENNLKFVDTTIREFYNMEVK